MTGAGDARAAALVEHARGRRWFGDKARRISAVRVRDEIPVEWPGASRHFAVLRLDVEHDAGRSTYQLFTDRDAGDSADALEQEEFRRGLVDAFAGSREFTHRGARWSFRAEGRRNLVVPPDAPITLSRTEQSNSSLIVDGIAILKIFRRLEPGIHPDVEVTRFLTIERRFLNVPVLLGTIRFEDADGETVAGMLQELVPGAVDGWSYALDSSRGWFRGAGEPGEPPFEGDAGRLGAVTRELHETLASGDAGSAFQSLPVSDTDLRDWIGQATRMLDRAAGSLARGLDGGALPAAHLGVARAAAGRVDALRRSIPGIIEALGADRGRMTRTHGDYHLGQVLRSASGQFFVIDFEGEPARPLAERRGFHSPLRDVAGMLRSFAYAAAVGAADAGARPDRAAAWEQRSREAFLRGYFAARRAGGGASALLPSDRAHADRLITLFEMEKIFYELQYELDHRPEWVWVPLAGIAQLPT